MAAEPDGPPVVPLPGRLDRTLRLGPFPSARAALKFLAYAGVGAAVAVAGPAVLGALFLGVGAVLTWHRPGGEPLDAQLRVRLGYASRRLRGARALSERSSRSAAGSRCRTLPDGRRGAVVRAGGVPLAFLPPAELARRFELYRELLNALEGDLWLLSTTAAIHRPSILPAPPGGAGPDRAARAGYRELVDLLARRRTVRRVYLALVSEAGGAQDASRLEVQADGLLGRLEGIGVRAERLGGAALDAAASRFGWRGGEAP